MFFCLINVCFHVFIHCGFFLFCVCSLPSPLLLFVVLHCSLPCVVVIGCGASLFTMHYCRLLWCVAFALRCCCCLLWFHPLPCAITTCYGALSLILHCCCLLWFVVLCLPPLLVWFITLCFMLLLVVLCRSSPCIDVVCCGLSPSPYVTATFCCGSLSFVCQGYGKPQEQRLKKRF
jgi:hypothetical protein